ncbi:hypothetical protein JB92DRAFT_3103017 [Gautieria morchelliformis]|nr:hypothetical protein JB92DRAFT_3103017 [Gautieria morchelliformis]
MSPLSDGRAIRRKPLLPLSLVSKRLHSECIPLSRISSYASQTRKIDSQEIQVRVLRIEDACIYPREIDHQVLVAKELWEAFPDMTSVTKCIYK